VASFKRMPTNLKLISWKIIQTTNKLNTITTASHSAS
jgi:hypothetical protein